MLDENNYGKFSLNIIIIFSMLESWYFTHDIEYNLRKMVPNVRSILK